MKLLSRTEEFILLAAQVQAQGQGVEAEGVIREGNVRDEIIQLCQEIQAEYVVLGNPKGEPEDNAFTRERLNRFAQSIELSSGAKAILAADTEP